jgi:hypothetical protein
MTAYQLTSVLRRDDLVLSRSQVDVLLTVEHGRERYHDDDVVLVERTDVDESVYEQALELVDDPMSSGKSYRYVPLMFGPVQATP